MEVSYTVRAVEPGGAASQLTGLLQRNLGASCRDPQRRVDWFYLEGPFGHGVAHLLEQRDGGAEAETVGCMGIGVRQYWVEGAQIPVALLGDLAVDKKHRSLGPALMLQRATRTYAQEHYPLLLGYPNAKARPTVLRLGFRELGQMRRYAIPLRFGPYLARRLPAPLAWLAGLGLDAGARLLTHGWRRAARRRFRLESLSAPDARFDRLWLAAREGLQIAGVRSVEFLTWRFLRQAAASTSRFYALVARESGELGAYAVVEMNGTAANVRDLLGRDREATGELIDLLLPELRRAGAASAAVSYLGGEWLVKLLTARGFRARDSRSVVVDFGRDAPGDPAPMLDLERWYLTEADEDG